MSSSIEVNANELRRALRKSHDRRTPDERRLLLSVYEPPDQKEIARRPFNLRDLERILFTPAVQLSARDEGRLASFLGALRIKQQLLEQKEAQKHAAA
jgi:hypothetical protein